MHKVGREKKESRGRGEEGKCGEARRGADSGNRDELREGNERDRRRCAQCGSPGSPLSNWHSILRVGLKNMSNTEYMSTGAGAALYQVAASFLLRLDTPIGAFTWPQGLKRLGKARRGWGKRKRLRAILHIIRRNAPAILHIKAQYRSTPAILHVIRRNTPTPQRSRGPS
jgi:hypothetical protein